MLLREVLNKRDRAGISEDEIEFLISLLNVEIRKRQRIIAKFGKRQKLTIIGNFFLFFYIY